MKRSTLEAKGFEGFLTTRELSAGRLKDVPVSPGIYVVISDVAEQPSYLASSIGGRFKGKDPTVAISALASRWVAITDVLYIGKADQLKRRIAQLCRYAAGEPVGLEPGSLPMNVRRIVRSLSCSLREVASRCLRSPRRPSRPRQISGTNGGDLWRRPVAGVVTQHPATSFRASWIRP